MLSPKAYNVFFKPITAAYSIPVVIIYFILSPAQAVTCDLSRHEPVNIQYAVLGTGMSTVGETVPVGKVLYSQEYRVAPIETTYSCNITTDDINAGLNKSMSAYTKIEAIGQHTSINGKDVFRTNVPGVGAVFYLSSGGKEFSAFPASWEITYPPVGAGISTQKVTQLTKIKFELIKTGPVSPGLNGGEISNTNLPRFVITTGANSPLVIEPRRFVDIVFSGGVIIYSLTCRLESSGIEVELGSHDIKEFSGPGSATKWKNFDIVLNDCPPFYGYNSYIYNAQDKTVMETREENKVDIGFRGLNGVVEGSPWLAKINDGSNVAKGVGIELSQRNISGSIPLDGTGSISFLDLKQEEGARYTIPLKARYVQADTKLEAGIANGSVVFTITYQ